MRFERGRGLLDVQGVWQVVCKGRWCVVSNRRDKMSGIWGWRKAMCQMDR